MAEVLGKQEEKLRANEIEGSERSVSEIEEAVRSIVADKLGIDEASATKIVREANFREDLGADSLDTVEIIMDVEDRFSISIPDEIAQKIVTVGDAIDYIHKAVTETQKED